MKNYNWSLNWSLKLATMFLVTKENWSLKISYHGFGYQLRNWSLKIIYLSFGY